jgi:hypothetical protein
MHASIEQYLEVLHAKRRAPATMKIIRHDFTYFVTWWEGARRRTFDLTLLRYEDLRDWRSVRQRDDGAAPATINRGLASFRGYCRWALASHLLVENPMADVKDVPTEPLAPRSLPAEAINALLRAAGIAPMRSSVRVMKPCWPCSSMRDCECRRSVISNCVILTWGAGRSRSGVARQARLVVSRSMLMRSAWCVGISMSFVAQQEHPPSAVTRNGSCSWSESMSPGEGSRPPQESPSGSRNEWCNR